MVEDRLRGAMLCRCTGYRPIVDAALAACEGPPVDRFLVEAEAIRATWSASPTAPISSS
jgi:xanthine dehydrogenase small subunit